MSLLSIAIMVVGMIGLIICAKKQKTNPAMQPLAFGCLVVVLVGLGISVYKNMTPDSGLMESEARFRNSKMAKIGQMLKQSNPGKKVVFVVYPNWEKYEISKKNIEQQMETFKEFYGSANIVATSLELPANFEEMGGDLESYMTKDNFEKMLAPHKDAGIVITDVGLPERQITGLSIVKDKTTSIVMLNEPNERIRVFRYVRDGKITAVCYKPRPRKSKKDKNTPPPEAPEDLLKAFDVRYFIVNKDNIEEHKADWTRR